MKTKKITNHSHSVVPLRKPSHLLNRTLQPHGWRQGDPDLSQNEGIFLFFDQHPNWAPLSTAVQQQWLYPTSQTAFVRGLRSGKRSKNLLKNIILLLGFLSVNAKADDLLTAYQQALRNDPTYLESISQNNALKSQYNIDRATVLPNVSIDSTAAQSRISGIDSHTYNTGINLQQTLFNYSDWLTLNVDKFSTNQADFSIDASKQDLTLRLAQAYLEVAKQQEILAFDKKQLLLSKQLADQSELFFKAGAKTDVDVTTSQAAYNQNEANLITDEMLLNDDNAKLASITGHAVNVVKIVRDDIPYLLPIPLNESAWIDKIPLHNTFILADQAAANASNENIKAQAATALPTLNTTVGYGYTKQQTEVLTDSGSGANISLNLSIPIYQGGLVAASTEQSRYQYLASFEKMNVDKQSFISQTKSSFIGIIQGIEQLKTNKNLIALNQKNYQETSIAYVAGIRNASDVVTSLNNLYQSQLFYLQAKYQYAENIIKLREAVGDLSVVDIEKLNAWLA